MTELKSFQFIDSPAGIQTIIPCPAIQIFLRGNTMELAVPGKEPVNDPKFLLALDLLRRYEKLRYRTQYLEEEITKVVSKMSPENKRAFLVKAEQIHNEVQNQPRDARRSRFRA